jgi:GNAT superfamily N-acetyltransferase
MAQISIRPAVVEDVPIILQFIRELGEYEKLAHEVVATEADLRRTLFEEPRCAEVLIGEIDGDARGLALFFHNYSTFLGKPGIYLEDLYVSPEARGSGLGLALLTELAGLAERRGCVRLEWSVLDWNRSAIEFYRARGAVAMDGWTTFRLTGEALSRMAGSIPRGDT